MVVATWVKSNESETNEKEEGERKIYFPLEIMDLQLNNTHVAGAV